MSDRNRYATSVSIFAAVGSVTYGYANAIIGQTIGQPMFYRDFHLAMSGPGLDHTNMVIGLMNGLYSAGGALGALSTAWATYSLGRLRNLQIACAVCLVGGALMAGAANMGMFQASRFIMGWGIGMMVAGVPLYQSEMATPTHRGRHVGFHGIGVCVGYTLTGFVGFGCYYDANSSAQWRLPFAIQLIPVLILSVGSLWLPESPRWLLSKGRRDEAWSVLRRLHASPGDPHDRLAKMELYQMREQFLLEEKRREEQHIRHWLDFLRQRSFLKRLAIGMGAQCINVSSGNLVINNYQVSLYGGLGITGSIPILLFAIWNVVGLWGNIMSAFFVLDRFGRKGFYMAGIAGCAVSHAAEGALTKYYVESGGPPNRVGLGFGIFFIFLFVAFYGVCLDNQQYVICSEVFPMEARGLGVALSLFGQFFGGALYVGVAPVAFSTIGWKFYMVFFSLCTVNVFIVWRFFPETKGLSLEEINEVFGDPVAVHLTNIDLKHQEELKIQGELLAQHHENVSVSK